MSEKKVDAIARESPLVIPDVMYQHYQTTKIGRPIPGHFIAEPSTVKSEMAYVGSKRIAEEIGRTFFDWNRSTLEEKEKVAEDPSGVFIFADMRALETDVAELRLQDMSNGKPYITFKYNVLMLAMSKPSAAGVLFLDEVNLAPQLTKAQFYKLINDHCIGDLPLSNGVLVMSAGNELAHSKQVTPDGVPLTTRRLNYFVRPLTDEEYTDYSIQSGQSPLISGYLKFAPTDVHRLDFNVTDSVGQPCPRTWTKLSHIISANPDMSEEDLSRAARAAVGQGVATKFISYVKMARNVDIDEVLKNPESLKKFENDLSLLYAVITGAVEKFRKDRKKFDAVMDLSLHMREELGAFMLRQVKQIAGPTKFKELAMSSKSFDKVADRYAKFFK